MKQLGVGLFLASTLAVAAYAATIWSQQPDPGNCAAPSHSRMPITAALEAWRCSETNASAQAEHTR